MGGLDIAQVLQLRHDISNGGRTEFEPGMLGQGLGPDWLATIDIVANQYPEQVTGTGVEIIFHSKILHSSPPAGPPIPVNNN